MMSMATNKILIVYLIAVNVATFFVYGIDKWKAMHGKWRISEATLIGLAVAGGSLGAWLGMAVWHHKTMHKKFKYGIPLIIVAQIAIALLASCRTKQVVELPAPVHEHRYEPEHSASVFLVMYDAEVGKAPLLEAIEHYGCEVVYDYHSFNGMALKKPVNKTLEETMQLFRKVKGVLTVEYDRMYRLTDPVKPRVEIK